MYTLRLRNLFALMLAAVLAACGGNNQPAGSGSAGGSGGVTSVTLALNWFPEAEHGGFYAAQLNGHYREAGLDVSILAGGPGAPVVPRVAQGQVDFGVTNADNLIFGRASQAPVVAVMASLQHSPRCIMVHADSGIDDFSKLGQLKTLAMSPKKAFSSWLKSKYDLSGVDIVPYAGNVARFLEDGKTYGQQGYNISEPFNARKKGANPVALMVSSTGFDPYTSMVVVSEKMAAERADVVRRFVAASVKGWRDYVARSKSTNGQIHTKNPEMGLDVLDFGAKEITALVDPAGGPVGRMDADRWDKLVGQLLELKLIEKGKVDPSKCFDPSFLPK